MMQSKIVFTKYFFTNIFSQIFFQEIYETIKRSSQESWLLFIQKGRHIFKYLAVNNGRNGHVLGRFGHWNGRNGLVVGLAGHVIDVVGHIGHSHVGRYFAWE